MLERNFRSSGEPKIACAERPATALTAAVQARRRAPSTGCAA
jgi:hypothetical protein